MTFASCRLGIASSEVPSQGSGIMTTGTTNAPGKPLTTGDVFFVCLFVITFRAFTTGTCFLVLIFLRHHAGDVRTTSRYICTYFKREWGGRRETEREETEEEKR